MHLFADWNNQSIIEMNWHDVNTLIKCVRK